MYLCVLCGEFVFSAYFLPLYVFNFIAFAGSLRLLVRQQIFHSHDPAWKFRRQVVIEPYIVDFVCLDAKLIIEADGVQYTEQATYDTRRTACLETMGYRIIRF